MTFFSSLLKPGLVPYLLPIILLICSNVFMTFAWYGHLKYKSVPLITVVLISWAIAFVEYCFAVPANRLGSDVYSPAELKTMQEVITLVVFAGFTALYFNEPLSWMQGGGFLLIALGAALVFHGQA
ncbi:MAG: DMT family protein [Methyloceanibacter sp.]|uniref:DMT family protein n=1 Tax=Methyloceanibacter sp. TaxID=1965321 RepID=UPI003EE41532